MDEELKSAKRTTVLVRLHQRYTMVRAARERGMRSVVAPFK